VEQIAGNLKFWKRFQNNNCQIGRLNCNRHSGVPGGSREGEGVWNWKA